VRSGPECHQPDGDTGAEALYRHRRGRHLLGLCARQSCQNLTLGPTLEV
jgi:hypothetical protein